jgi:hypothetical protein
MVMRGVRFASMLVVYLAPRLNTSDDPGMEVAVGELGPSLRRPSSGGNDTTVTRQTASATCHVVQ